MTKRKIALLSACEAGVDIARDLAESGYSIALWDADADRCEALADIAGSVRHPSHAAAVAEVVVVVADDPAVSRDLIQGRGAAAIAAPAGASIIEMSPAGIAERQSRAERLARIGKHYRHVGPAGPEGFSVIL